jgi:hypothetical protein
VRRASLPERRLQQILEDVSWRLPVGAAGEILRGLRHCYRAGELAMRRRAAGVALREFEQSDVAEGILRLAPRGGP